jgi:hypothetical protein
MLCQFRIKALIDNQTFRTVGKKLRSAEQHPSVQAKIEVKSVTGSFCGKIKKVDEMVGCCCLVCDLIRSTRHAVKSIHNSFEQIFKQIF